ncbi:MAG: hypothetical protein WAV40_05035 [Microgenomates group bacterium]
MSFLRGIPRPLLETKNDLNRALRKNQPPLLNEKSILDLLQLTADERDGLSLADRLLFSDNPLDQIKPTTVQLYTLSQTISLTEKLLARLDGHKEDYNQLAVAKNMIAVAERQISREGGACPLATGLYKNITAIRPELVNPQISAQIGGPQELLGMLMQLIESSSRQMSDFGEFEIRSVDMSKNRKRRE